jgi:aquaporin Z
MIQIIAKHWKAYLMEAAGLAGFVIGAGLLTIFLEHPDLRVMHSSLKDYPLLRRVPLGIIMGAYIAGVTLLFGKKSGAQINPVVTFTFFRLGKINFIDASLYTIAQFAGAVGAAQVLKYFTAGLFSHPLIDFGVTKPKPPYETMTAFTAEFIISFIMMLVLLFAISSKRFEKKVALISGMLLGLYLVFETPFSGMSLNPARSFAGALAANEWKHLWVYFVAPPFAMLIAAEIFEQWKKKMLMKKDKDYKEISKYPVEAKV